ncbi:caspase family protein [Methylomonas paludis]|uniref:Caspase family protein n=1 Tax=Methylomonas paludis TaxID=1173101 RepID=A0A975MQV6_9GAMM|nr:caspase family protein [Methylomonas paludis]QWF72368.1 caspase family protein [Methylomonas paludis]
MRIYFVLLIVFASVTNADNYPEKPLLRIEVGQHTAMINRMAADKAGKLLATVSDDKTLRLWNLPEGTHYTTLRVPIDEQLKGALYAVAVSPDGKTVITAGATGDAEQLFSIYVFDTAERLLKARISGQPSAIYHLSYSPDGKYFAAAFAGGYGVRIWDSQTGKLVGQDQDYDDRVNWLDFDQNGHMVSASYDGFIRVYGSDFKLIKKIAPHAGLKPASVSYSADGQKLAVGYANALRVDILDTQLNLTGSLVLDNALASTHANASIVAWDKTVANGLYAGGNLQNIDGYYIIRHWSDAGKNEYNDIKAGSNTVTDIISLAQVTEDSPKAFYSSAEPAWAAIDQDNELYKHQAQLWDARAVELPGKIFAVSGNGLTIAYSADATSDKVFSFDVNTLEFHDDTSADVLAQLSSPSTEAGSLKVKDWRRGLPLINGVTPEFERYELAYAAAVSSTGDHALLGTNYNLRVYAADGRQIKKIYTPAAVYAVNIAGNGKLALAALGDGTIRWYSLENNEELRELATLFPYNEGKDWIIWTEEGFFGNSDGGGEKLAGYHLNKGEDKRPEWIEFSQVYQLYYSPELIKSKLLRQEEGINQRLQTIQKADERFNNKAIPLINLAKYCVPSVQTEPTVTLSELGWLERFTYYLELFLQWCQNLFGLSATPSATRSPIVAENQSNPDPDPASCQEIAGQGQTRGFLRKASVKSSTYRNQLAGLTHFIDLYFRVNPRSGGSGDIDIYVNNQIRHTLKPLPENVATAGGNYYKQRVYLQPGNNSISVQAYEQSGGAAAVSGSIELINPPDVTPPAEAEGVKPKLAVLAIGIDRYREPNQLKFAVKDAKDVVAALQKRKSTAYGGFVPITLFDEQATLSNIEASFDKLAALLRPEDSVLIYFAGHGLKYENDFYFIPVDVNDDNLAGSAISQAVLKRNIAKLEKTNRVFVFLDSCHSGAVTLDGIQQDIIGFDKIKHQLGDNIFILAAAGEDQEGQDQFKSANGQTDDNGLFAHVVLEGLNGLAHRADDNVVDSLNLGSFVQRRIDKVTQNQTLYKQKARFQLVQGGDILNFDITHYE